MGPPSEQNLPDWLTEELGPAYFTKVGAFPNREMSSASEAIWALVM